MIVGVLSAVSVMEAGGDKRFFFRQAVFFLAQRDALQQESHVAAERAHGLVVAPFKMCLELFIQFFYAAKMLPIVKIPLVVAVTALHLAIVPRRSRRNQNMFDTPFLQQLIHRIFLGFTDEFVSKFSTVVRLNCLDRKRKCLDEHFQKLIATSKIAVTLDNCSKRWYNMSQGDEKI